MDFLVKNKFLVMLFSGTALYFSTAYYFLVINPYGSVSETLDAHINKTLDRVDAGELAYCHADEYHLKICDDEGVVLSMWTANYPYASSRVNGYLPKYRTRRRVESISCSLREWCT